MRTYPPPVPGTHILVVEDEEHLATGIKFNLEAEGFRVTTSMDGPTALRVLGQQSFDLVILDLMLPGMSGYTVCETLRQTDAQVPVLILSARTLSEDRTRGFDVGADQYLTKPFELDELLSRVRRLLARHGQPGKPAPRPLTPNALHEIDQGRVRVDADRYQVLIGDRSEQLTPLEVRLLVYFITHADRVISRSELLEAVWEQPGYLQTRAVDQFIRRLRKLIELNPSEPRHLLTVRDAGYRFVPHPTAVDERP